MTRTFRLVVALGAFVLLVPTELSAAGVGKALARGSSRALARRFARPALRPRASELLRDRKAPISILKRGRLVDRYTLASRAAREAKGGLPPLRHMTSLSTRRPLSASAAQKRLGLPVKPQVVERIRLKKGTTVHFNKVTGGKPGYGEITAPSRIGPSAVERLIPLRK